MRTKMKRLISMLLSVALVMGIMLPAWAANENNNLGVTFSATLDQATLSESDQDQEVTMYLKASKGVEINGMELSVVWNEKLQLNSIFGGESRINIADDNLNLEKGKVAWSAPKSANIADVTDLLEVTFTVPANTPAGEYEIDVKGLELTNYVSETDPAHIWENAATASATLTITEAAKGYTAGLATLNEEVSVSDRVEVNVGVSHDSDTVFAAGEIKINYDNTKLTFNKEASILGNATVQDNNGTLTLEDYGTDKSFGTGVYVLAFDAIADGEATVTLTSAAFVDKENAVKSDLITAALTPAELTIKVNKKTHAVTLQDIFTGPTTVIDGEDYTFQKADGANYNYSNVSATMNGEPATVIDNGNGSYTIENVTGALVITGTRTEKTYEVTFSGSAASDITDGATTATYNQNYTFTMPSASGWAYKLEEIKIGGTAYTGYTVKDAVYTIPGSAINGNIEIMVSKNQTIASVTVDGTGAGAATGYESSATIGQDYTLTLTPEAGYAYTVSATVNGTPVEVTDNGDNTYTIKAVAGNVVFTVERTVLVDGVTVSEYVTLNGTKMWLVKNEITVAEGKVPTYGGEKMFRSEKYNAYCYLTIAETLDNNAAAKLVDITDGEAVTVDYGMDVNRTGKVDASDAQLIYNMYNVTYNEFTEEATVEKFLRADVNGDATVNVQDATAVINALLS